MADSFKRLGSADLAATTNTDVFTVGASKEVIIKTITFCNRNTAAVTVRFWHKVGGTGAPGAADYLAYDIPIQANDSFVFSKEICMVATDTFGAYSSTTNVTVSAHGLQMDV